MLAVSDPVLDEGARSDVIGDLMAGVLERERDVYLAESASDAGVAGRGTVLSLLRSDSREALRGAASSAAAVVYVGDGQVGGVRRLLGLDGGLGYQVPMVMVAVRDEPLENIREVRRMEAVDVLRVVDGAGSRRASRELRKIGRRLAGYAVAPRRLDAADQVVRVSAVEERAEEMIRGLMAEEGVEEYQIRGGERMMVAHSAGTVSYRDSPFRSEQELIDAARFLAMSRHVRFDPLFPRLDIRVGDRWRLHAEGFVVSPAHMVLRSNMAGVVKLEDLGLADERLCAVLRTAICGGVRANVIVAATMGGGKTTLCQALLAGLDDTERVDTIEDTPELRLAEYGVHGNTYERLTRDANTDGVGKHTMADHIRDAKRANSGKLVVGEVRGEGTLALLDAMSSGMSGCLATLHSQPGSGVVEKIVSYAMMEGAGEDYARAQIGSGVHLLVWLGRNVVQERVIADVTEVMPVEGGVGLDTRSLWRLPEGGERAAPVAEPGSERIRMLYKEAGVDEMVAAEIQSREQQDLLAAGGGRPK